MSRLKDVSVKLSELIPGVIYDFRIKDILVSTAQFQSGEVKRRCYVGPFHVGDIPFIEVTDALRGEHLIPVELIAEIRVTDLTDQGGPIC